MSITELAIGRSRVTAVALVALFFAGISAFFGMPQQMDPGFIVRTAQVVTIFPGASPERVEQLVTDPIEQAVQSIPELDHVGSTSRTGVSVVAVNIKEKHKDMRPIWDSMRRKIDATKSSLPEGIVGPNINDELGDTFPMLISMTGDGFSAREMADYAKTLRDSLLHVDGVAKVEVIGEQDQRVFVEYSNAQLRQLGVSSETIKRTLGDRNIIMPGGQIDIGPERISLEPSGNFNAVAEIESTLVPLPGGGSVHLGDITSVRRSYIDPPEGLVTVNGVRGITFAVSMADGDNLVELGKTIKRFFSDAEAHYPHGIDFHQTYFQPLEVEAKVDEFMSNVYQAIAIVLAVMLLTLGLRTGLIVSTLIPGAMIITVLVLSMLGDSLNQMSLAALIIALGLLVDNAIVVSESIMVRMGQGMPARQAAIESCKELQTPLLVSSLTTAAAFLPIYLAESMVGEYTGSLFTVVSITLLVSWVLALTMTPLLCTLFLKVPPKESDPFGGPAYRVYRSVLSVVIRGRWISLAVVSAVFAASLQLWQFVPQIFFPSQDSPFFMAQFDLPAGSSIEATMKMSEKLDDFIEEELMANQGDAKTQDGQEAQKSGGVLSWTTFIGETPPPFTLGYAPSPSLGGYCELMINSSDVASVKDAMRKLHAFAIREFPDVKTHIRMLSAGPPVDKPVQIRISGPPGKKLFDIVDDVQAQLRSIEGARNVANDWGARVKKLKVSVDEERARRAGLTNSDVADTLQSFLSGKQATLYREGEKSIPVMVRSVAADRRDLEKVRNLSVFSPVGGSVPLSQVADISLEWDDSAILRRDRYRTVTVEAGVSEGVTAMEVFEKIRPFMQEQQSQWGVGYRWAFGGEIESSVKANESIGVKMPIALMCIVMLLVAQFNSIRKPVIVLSTIVLALIGVVVGLVVMQSSFGFMTLLGVVSLAGIVINNAIVLIDRIQIEIDENGLPVKEAAVAAAQQRVRPILLTTATTVASLIPLYLSGGEMWKPMSVAIMFGLVFSTILTLGCVPLLYTILYRDPVPEDEDDGLGGSLERDDDEESFGRSSNYFQQVRWNSRLWS